MLGYLLICLTILIPVVCGLFVMFSHVTDDRKKMIDVSIITLIVSAVLMVLALIFAKEEVILLRIGEGVAVRFQIDALGRLFAIVTTVVWLLAGFFAEEYMKHEREEKRYFGFYLIVYGVLMALCFAGNLITYYFFFEMMTLTSLPMVAHSKTREAISAGIKYLLYSMLGAYMVLYALFFLNRYTSTLNFIPGGSMIPEQLSANGSMILVLAMLLISGFGVKAGLFPLHGWLPTAHPVAPAPASAVLSAIIVKFGVLGIIRSIYYVVGYTTLQGTWVQKVWITITLITVFMGSYMAYRTKLLKKRLAYSTVSQVSYILFGLSMMQPEAMTGSLLHVVFHACIKSLLFLSAGAIIFKTGKTQVDELNGIGKEMPVALWCYTFAALALVGIPPFSGFVSKWYLCIGSLDSGMRFVSWFGPVVLLLSALLTAAYLFPITINGFLPGKDYDYAALVKKEPVKNMLIPLMVLAFLVFILGVFPGGLVNYITDICQTLF